MKIWEKVIENRIWSETMISLGIGIPEKTYNGTDIWYKAD